VGGAARLDEFSLKGHNGLQGLLIFSVLVVVALLMVNYRKLTSFWSAKTVPADVMADAKRHVKAPILPDPPEGTTGIEF